MESRQKNKIIREAQRSKRYFGYEIAALLGISESTFGRMMRKELPIEEQKRIAEIIMKGDENAL